MHTENLAKSNKQPSSSTAISDAFQYSQKKLCTAATMSIAQYSRGATHAQSFLKAFKKDFFKVSFIRYGCPKEVFEISCVCWAMHHHQALFEASNFIWKIYFFPFSLLSIVSVY